MQLSFRQYATDNRLSNRTYTSGDNAVVDLQAQEYGVEIERTKEEGDQPCAYSQSCDHRTNNNTLINVIQASPHHPERKSVLVRREIRFV